LLASSTRHPSDDRGRARTSMVALQWVRWRGTGNETRLTRAVDKHAGHNGRLDSSKKDPIPRDRCLRLATQRRQGYSLFSPRSVIAVSLGLVEKKHMSSSESHAVAGQTSNHRFGCGCFAAFGES
jgi:hypothetical protein